MSGQTIGKAYVQIMPSVKGLAGNLKNAMNSDAVSAGESAGSGFGSSMVGAIKGVIAAAGIGAALKASLDEGGALQQSLGGVETLFKENADTVKEYANQAYRTAGMSANEYMETVTGFSASLLQSLGGDTAKAAESADMALRDMSDNANKFGTDMESIKTAYAGFAKQNYTMLDNLKLGYGGTKSEMERLLADAKALTGVEYNIDSLDDVYQAIHVIQSELGVTGTTAKEAASTLAGSAASMKAAFTNVLGKLAIGEDISADLDALKDSLQVFLFDNVLPMVGNIAERIPQLVEAAGSMVIQGLNMLGNNAGDIAGTVVDTIVSLAEAIIGAAPYVIEAALSIVAEIGSKLIEMDWIEIITSMMTNMRDSMDLAAGEILGTDGSIVSALIAGISETLPGLIQAAADIIGTIIGAITENLPVLMENGVQIISELVNGIMSNLPALIEGAGQIGQTVLTAILELLPSIMESGINLVGSVADGMTQNAPAVLNSIAEALSGLIQTIVEHLPEILEKGKELLGNVAQGIIEALPDMVKAAAETVAGFLAEIGAHLPEVLEEGITLLGELIAGIIKSIPDVVSAAADIIGNIVDAFDEYDWGSIGLDLIRGIADGVAGAASELITAATNVLGDAWDAMTGWLDIASPSKKAKRVIGKNWALGIGDGFVEGFPEGDMLSSVKDAFGDIQNEVLGFPAQAVPALVTGTAFPGSATRTVDDIKDVLDAIKELREAMMSMKIVMDSGELVGAVQEMINEILGKEAQRAKWQ